MRSIKDYIEAVAGKCVAEGCESNSDLSALLDAVSNTILPEFCRRTVINHEFRVRRAIKRLRKVS